MAFELLNKNPTDKNTELAIQKLLETERNFVLKKGETTVNLEHEKIATIADEKMHRILETVFTANIKEK